MGGLQATNRTCADRQLEVEPTADHSRGAPDRDAWLPAVAWPAAVAERLVLLAALAPSLGAAAVLLWADSAHALPLIVRLSVCLPVRPSACLSVCCPGRYLLVKDPNKELLRLYAVPEDAFESNYAEEPVAETDEVPADSTVPAAAAGDDE